MIICRRADLDLVIARSSCDEAIHPDTKRKNGLLRFARNDGYRTLMISDRLFVYGTLMRGWCQGDGYRVGFGEVEGTITPAV